MDRAGILFLLQAQGHIVLGAPAVQNIAVAHVDHGMAGDHQDITGPQILLPAAQKGNDLISGHGLVLGNAVLGVDLLQLIAWMEPAHQRHARALEPEVGSSRAQIIFRSEHSMSQRFIVHLIDKVAADGIDRGVRRAELRSSIFRQAIISAGIFIEAQSNLFRAVLHLAALHVVCPGSSHQCVLQFLSGIYAIVHHFVVQGKFHCCGDGHRLITHGNGLADRQGICSPGCLCRHRRKHQHPS